MGPALGSLKARSPPFEKVAVAPTLLGSSQVLVNGVLVLAQAAPTWSGAAHLTLQIHAAEGRLVGMTCRRVLSTQIGRGRDWLHDHGWRRVRSIRASVAALNAAKSGCP